jgi:signal transduction histidine kinase
MKVAGKRVGLIALYRNTNEAFTEDDLAFVRTIGSHVGMAISFVALEARAERLAVLDERARIGADLHDGILQILSSVRVYALELRSSLDAIRDEMDRERATPAYIALSKLEDCVDTGSEEVTAAIRQFREPDACLDVRTHLDIARDRLEASGIATTVECDIRDIASEVSDAVGWIVREAASNVLHHSQAEHVTIDVHTSGDSLELLIADDGVGGRASTDRRGAAFDERPLGQKIMRERAEHLGGQLTVVAGTGGTTVRARMPAVPLREEASRIRVPGD